jgi:catechol 2,3-dioxygenase-like lactoylglutathione lyase family enzyme
LGFEITKRMDERGTYIDNMTGLTGVLVTTIKLSAPDGQMIELLYYHSHPLKNSSREINGVGISHIAFTVDDLEKVYTALSGKGVIFNAPPQLSQDGYAKVTFCRAPEGTFIELVEVL